MKKIYPVVIFSLLFFSCISTDADFPSADTSSQSSQENLQVQPVNQTQDPQKEEISELEQEQDQEQNQELHLEQEQFEQEKKENTLEEKVEEDIFIEEQYPLEEKIPENELADDFEKLQKNIEYNFEEKIENLDEELFLPEKTDGNLEKPLTLQPAQTEQIKQPSSSAQNENQKAPGAQPDTKTEQKNDRKLKNTQKPTPSVQGSPAQTESEKQQETKNTSLSMQEEVSQIMNSENKENLPEHIQESTPVCSRSVTIKNNQYLDINYPGTGWIYLGEYDRQNLLVFFSRKITGSNTTFSLMSRKSGTAILHFYKNDALSGKYIDDYIQVQVEHDSATDNNHITAPEYSKVIPPKPQKTYTEELTDIQVQNPEPTSENTLEKNQYESKNEQLLITEDNIQTNIKNTALPLNPTTAETENKTSEIKGTNPVTQKQNDFPVNDNLLELAKNAYSQEQYEQALQFVNNFLDNTSEKIDEGIFLKAKILETRSSVQNIKEAVSNYDKVVSDFPQSSFWNKSKERSLYLKRFYIDIR